METLLNVILTFGILYSFGLVFFTFKMHKRDELKDFKRIFGFSPHKEKERKKIEQNLVDAKLASLASSFFSLANEESILLNFIKANKGKMTESELVATIKKNKLASSLGEFGLEDTSLLEIVAFVKEKLLYRKKDFRYGHTLAGNFNFLVSKNIGDYVL